MITRIVKGVVPKKFRRDYPPPTTRSPCSRCGVMTDVGSLWDLGGRKGTEAYLCESCYQELLGDARREAARLAEVMDLE